MGRVHGLDDFCAQVNKYSYIGGHKNNFSIRC